MYENVLLNTILQSAGINVFTHRRRVLRYSGSYAPYECFREVLALHGKLLLR